MKIRIKANHENYVTSSTVDNSEDFQDFINDNAELTSFREFFFDGLTALFEPQSNTLTKREQFAMAAMQSLTAAYPCSDDSGIQHNAQLAVKTADSLIKELEK